MSRISTVDFELTPLDNQQLSMLCGSLEQNLRQIEKRLGVEISNRSNHFRVTGPGENARAAQTLLMSLYRELNNTGSFDAEAMHLALSEMSSTLDTNSVTKRSASNNSTSNLLTS